MYSLCPATRSSWEAGCLQQIGLKPDLTLPANIDETPKKAELPRAYAERLARPDCLVRPR